MTKKKSYIIAFYCLILSLFNFFNLLASATDITIETYVEGGLTLVLNGDFNSNLNFSEIKRPSGSTENQTAYWQAVDTVDYIDFVDDTTTSGFYIGISFSDLNYSGPNGGSPLPASRYKLYGEYSTSPSTSLIGSDDPTKTVSILPNSCTDATPDKFTLHSDLTSSNSNYAITGSNSEQIVMESTVPCTNLGHLRFDRIELQINSTDAIGTYSGTINFTIYDGTPA